MDKRIAIKIMLWLVVAITIFHIAILFKVIPYEITWGGRLKSDSEMYVFESISLAINFFLGLVLLIKGEYVKQILPLKVVNLILWAFLVLFLLNTIGNLVAKTNFEKYFAIITLSFSILIWIILRKSKKLRRHNNTYSA
jgi:FtsH-binding integral membrane protein